VVSYSSLNILRDISIAVALLSYLTTRDALKTLAFKPSNDNERIFLKHCSLNYGKMSTMIITVYVQVLTTVSRLSL
jgi:hypothetical protein